MSPSYSSLNLVLLGPPGSGKSTQASRLASSFHLPHISTRAMLRDEVDRGTSVGVDARKVMERGELVPDRVLAGLMLQRLDRDDCARGCILDGYPRTVEQAILLDGILAELGRSIERVVLIDLPLEVGVRRLIDAGDVVENNGAIVVEDVSVTGRHDYEDVVRERCRVWRENAPALLDFYRHRGLLLEIAGDRPIDEVGETVRQAVGAPVGA